MNALIRHRGPSSDGRIDARFARIRFRRLSIIDLETGDQPVSNASGTIEVFLNGEIYNHRALRRELESSGRVFRTQSDAEVIPYLFEEHGIEFLTRLNGMYAIVICDHERGELYLCRDRFGIKPLYYGNSAGSLIFGSELKPLLASGMIEPEIDQTQLLSFLTLFYTPGEQTLVRGIKKLAPGSYLKFSSTGVTSSAQYYSLPLPPKEEQVPLNLDSLDEILEDSVKLRLVADVPVGISLSGGLDSSLITSYAARAKTSNLKLFTIHFKSTPPIELESARAVAAHFGLEHVIVQSTTSDFVENAVRMMWVNDEPIADPAYYSAMKIAEKASEHVTVLLSGAGADELFAGYGHYSLTRKKEWYASAQFLHRFQAIDRLIGDRRSPGALEGLKQYRESRLAWHLEAMSSLSATERSDLWKQIPGSANPAAALASAFGEADGIGPLNQQLYADLRTYLADQLLPVLDRSTMAASIEGRVPFLDHRLVEAAFAIRGSDKLGVRGKPKAILRRLGSKDLPPQVLSRPKHGFPNSVLEWFDAGLGNALPAILSRPSGLASQYLPRPWVQSLTESPATIRKQWRVLYSLLVLEIWYELLMNRDVQSAPSDSLSDLLEVRIG